MASVQRLGVICKDLVLLKSAGSSTNKGSGSRTSPPVIAAAITAGAPWKEVVPKPLVDLLTSSKRAGKELIGETAARLFLEQRALREEQRALMEQERALQRALMEKKDAEHELGLAELRRQNERLRFQLEMKNAEMLRLKGLFNMRGILEWTEIYYVREKLPTLKKLPRLEKWQGLFEDEGHAELMEELAFQAQIEGPNTKGETREAQLAQLLTRMFGKLSGGLHTPWPPQTYNETGSAVTITPGALEAKECLVLATLCKFFVFPYTLKLTPLPLSIDPMDEE
eukprot:TRINITY_DN11197_c0_g1_i1.p1 TRINITY_DN11197_c0_g1~~TRINITY_DN11197_c0_g1_i1.p1  ORF type:complete len:283 (-),score=81.78 TRINITY_DN11197_c0_g1_i1:275-1123(-)